MFSKRWILLFAIHLTKAETLDSIMPPQTTTTKSFIAQETEREDVQILNTELLPNTSICGNSSLFDQFPWTVLIEHENTANGRRRSYCGGFLINERYVLTAAACIIGALDRNYKIVGVRLGEINASTDPDCIKIVGRGVQCAASPLDVEVEEQIAHESYALDSNNRHDIALLRLKQRVEFSETVRPICLPVTADERSRTYVGERLTVVGWGKTEMSHKSSVKLKVQVPVSDQEECRSKYHRRHLNLGDGQFCAGGELGRDSCGGDGGNPIMVLAVDENIRVHWHAVGIVSFGASPCGMKDWPSVYTNISSYMPWIVNKLRP